MAYDIQKLLDNLTRRRMTGFFVEAPEDLIPLLRNLIPTGATVGVGGSVTLQQTGVIRFLEEGNYTFYNRYREGLSDADKKQLHIRSFGADTYLTGTNAVTMDGQLFNVDGNGNRVAAMMYGPRQVIVVVGINKLMPDVDTAIKRARQISAPLNAKRLGRNTPCVSLGKCVDCRHQNRICNEFVLIAGQADPNRIKVIVVNKVLGF